VCALDKNRGQRSHRDGVQQVWLRSFVSTATLHLLLPLTMKHPLEMCQHTVARHIRRRFTAITATIPEEEAPAANHHPGTASMAVCIDAAEPVPAVLASEASGETILTYSALASEASGVGGHKDMVDDTLMPRLPPVEFLADLLNNDGGIWCKECGMWVKGSENYRKHLVGEMHSRILMKAARNIPSPFPT
jgi:hypothetical protein